MTMSYKPWEDAQWRQDRLYLSTTSIAALFSAKYFTTSKCPWETARCRLCLPRMSETQEVQSVDFCNQNDFTVVNKTTSQGPHTKQENSTGRQELEHRIVYSRIQHPMTNVDPFLDKSLKVHSRGGKVLSPWNISGRSTPGVWVSKQKTPGY